MGYFTRKHTNLLVPLALTGLLLLLTGCAPLLFQNVAPLATSAEPSVPALALMTESPALTPVVLLAPTPEISASSVAPSSKPLRLISVSSDGAVLSSTPYWLYSGEPSISTDGRYVAFHTLANLVVADSNQQADVYVHDLQTGATELVSTGLDDAAGNSASMSSSISADGRYVGFSSAASDLVPMDFSKCALADASLCNQIYMRDRQNHAMELISVAPDGSPGSGSSYGRPGLSADGRFVAFTSEATNLVKEAISTCLAGQTSCRQVYVRDRLTGAMYLISKSANGEPGNGESDMPSISADGQWITFESYASNLVEASVEGRQIYIHDLQTGITSLISTKTRSSPSDDVFHDAMMPALSADGHWVVFNSLAHSDPTPNSPPPPESPGFLVMANREGTEFEIVMDHIGNWPSLSADGRWITFSTNVSLVPEDTNGVSDVYLYDRQTSTFQWVSASKIGGQASGGTYASVSSDGQWVAFDSMSRLLPEDQWGDADTYVLARNKETD